MPIDPAVYLTGAVEGDVDEAVLVRIAQRLGLTVGTVHGRQGKSHLLRALPGYNMAARFTPWVVVLDLDRDCDCAPPCRSRWLPAPSANMHFRIAVRSIESWLLADRERIAAFLGVQRAVIPADPDSLDDPKGTLVGLARRSRRHATRAEMVPTQGGGRRVGPLYSARLIEFASDREEGWRPEVASLVSDSLARCMQALGSRV
jgi:hypothetical protein